jgi:hypothetical protein
MPHDIRLNSVIRTSMTTRPPVRNKPIRGRCGKAIEGSRSCRQRSLRRAGEDYALRTTEACMPRYYFRLTNGKQVLDNHKGVDLPGDAAARTDAITLARDLKHGAVLPGWEWTGWFVGIIDQQGHKVDDVPIAEV